MYQTDDHSRRSKTTPKRSRIGRRMLRQLAAALALFGIWVAIRQTAPETAQAWGERLSSLIASSTDLWEACGQLGEDLSRGEDINVSVGNWCETVFLPQTEPDDGRA